MQSKKSICGLFLASALLYGCYEDKGNYTYHEINEVEIEGLLDTYAVDVDDSLIIVPTIKGSLYSDTAAFSYSWEMNGEVVGTEHDLRIQINQRPGHKYSRLVIADRQTGVKSYHEFSVNVSSSTAGDLIMVLSKYQGRAELSYLRLDKPANWAVNYYKDRYDVSLGTNPQQLAICYTESARSTPFVNRYGRVMALIDNVVTLIDKSSLMIDTVTAHLTQEAYTSVISYPRPEISGYKSEFVNEVISIYRKNPYGSSAQMSNNFIEISNGHIFAAFSLAPSIWTATYYYDRESPYKNGYLDPFGYWDDMSDTPHNNLRQAGYNPGDFIVFDGNNGRFAYASYGSVYSIDEADVKAFPGYNLQWGSATNRPNETSIAVLNNGSSCRLVLLQNGKDANDRATKKLVGEAAGGNMTPSSRFQMMKYNDNLIYSQGNGIYRYNIMNISGGTPPSERDKIIDLTQLGYDAQAVITDICLSRTEKTLLVGVSRYNGDPNAEGDEPKGDVLYFDFDSGAGTLQYNAEKSARGVAGIPVDIEIKYQTHYRNGLDFDGILKDNI